ncbi:DeoR/GlpR family DNA-binding transcription regulator [Lachnospiraceae bacterium LCP25S3_G4]
MLVAERQQKIIDMIQEKGSVQVEELAQELKVSLMTIRRDLEKLHEDGRIERCHGGAVVKQEVTYADKQIIHKSEKTQLAFMCENFVKTGDCIYLDAGTTTYEIAKVISKIPDIIVVTNDLEIARLLKESSVELFLCGGQVQKSTGSTLGCFATQMLDGFQFDVGFFGAASINEQLQVLTPTIDKAFMKRKIMKHCQETYLVVDDSKFNRQAMVKVNELCDYDGVITNRLFSELEQQELERTKVKVIQVINK